MSRLHIRVFGTGNAWPILIGSEHRFYDRHNPGDLANTAFSIFETNKKKNIIWEVIIDAGHGVPQHILNDYNRIPEAIVLTHSHLDHTAGLDWIVQSHYRINKSHPFPIYCTKLCWDYLINSFPHLNGLMEHIELIPSITTNIKEVDGLNITPFPVYHGPNSKGAILILAELEQNKKIIFTGDILCPLMRKTDYKKLKNPDFLFADANNRYPYPNSNHWSILPGFINENEDFLTKWKSKINISYLTKPHTYNNSDKIISNYIDEFISEQYQNFDVPISILDFAKLVQPKKIGFVHYSGLEDHTYYDQRILTKIELLEWCRSTIGGKYDYTVPTSGEIFKI
ncbi:MBL fold metallo-hydrolase [Bacteroidota bacterium]